MRPAFLSSLLRLAVLVAGSWFLVQVSLAAPSPLGPIPSAAAGPALDPAGATRAYLDTVPTDARARSDAYFEGGYWLLLWNALLAAAISLLLLGTGWSAAWRDRAARVSRRPGAQVAIYAIFYALVTYALSFPLTSYEHFFREHQYGMATQHFPAWLGQQMVGLGLQVVGTVLFLLVLYAVFRRAPRTWWLWGAGVMVFSTVLLALITPVFIQPLFNKYQPLEDPAVRDPILAMARANEIPVQQVFTVDQSRQTKRVSANVSGLFGTARIALNDNLLQRCSLPEIRFVMAHEMGHYVLNHVYKLIGEFAALFILGFALARVVFDAALRRWGARWRLQGLADPAAFPLLALLLTGYSFLLTPVMHNIVREVEEEADAFGINCSREPDGFAQVALKLGEYRKLDPGPLEELIFFDHPCGRARIRRAMDWKAAHLPAGGGATPTSGMAAR